MKCFYQNAHSIHKTKTQIQFLYAAYFASNAANRHTTDRGERQN